MFTYCLNNPVRYSDSEGVSATVAGGIAGGAFGFFNAWLSEKTDDNEGVRWDKVWACTVSGAAAGAAAGFVADVSIATCGVVPAIAASVGSGALASGANSAYTQYTLTGTINRQKVFSDAILGGITNGLCTATSDVLKPVVNGIKEGIEYVSTQIISEVYFAGAKATEFVVKDLLPTVITGFGAWYGGVKYDLLTK